MLRGLSLAALWAAGLLLFTGCTPKRVVNNEILTGENPPPEARPRAEPPPSAVGEQPRKPGGSLAAGEDLGTRAVQMARAQLGKMYQWGAEGPDRFDCSGLVYYVYSELGVAMPRVSSQQAKMGLEIDRKNLRPGDLLYFNTSGKGINHVGIYLGQKKFIHAPRKGMPVRTDSLNNGWWKQKYRGARRIHG